MPARAPHHPRWKACLSAIAIGWSAGGCDEIGPRAAAKIPTPELVAAAEQVSDVPPTDIGPPLVDTDPIDVLSDSPVVPLVRDQTPLRNYTDWSLAETAADSLGRIGATAVPDLVRILQLPNARLRLRATRVLGRIGPDAALAVPQLALLLDDADPLVARAAARALGQIGPNAAQAVPALIRHFKDPPVRFE